MEESRSHWFTEEYTPKRDAAIGAYVHTPASSGAVLREFERALQKAWDEVLPEMETPHDTVPVLRKNIERRLTSLKDALNRDKNKELVSDQPTPATETLVSPTVSGDSLRDAILTCSFCLGSSAWVYKSLGGRHPKIARPRTLGS
jgi:hypothetical protein